jgi:hypothetical protein
LLDPVSGLWLFLRRCGHGPPTRTLHLINGAIRQHVSHTGGFAFLSPGDTIAEYRGRVKWIGDWRIGFGFIGG